MVSDSSRPHGLQPTRLLRPWDFLGKSTGVGCHCLLCCISEVIDISLGNLDSSLCFIQPSNLHDIFCIQGFLDDSDGKEATCNAGDLGSIPGLGRSPGGGHGNPLCRGPAPVDPGNSKGGRRWRGKACLFINVRLD